jgi:hypothetical protein
MTANFLHATGTNGFIATPFSLMTTELNTLTNGSVAVSSVNGTSGVFNQTDTAHAQYGYIWLTLGGNFAATPAVGACITGWFINSTDGGTTFEKSSAAPPRAPDFVIPLTNAAYSASDVVYASGLVQLPYGSFKVLIQNNAGTSASTASSGNILKCAPVADQY